MNLKFKSPIVYILHSTFYIICVFLIAIPTLAASSADQLQQRTRNLFGQSGYVIDEGAGVPLAVRVGAITRAALMLVGIVFLAITVYSGIRWMTAAGNEEQVTKARARIVRAIVGLAIVLGAWIIVSFVLTRLLGGPAGAPSLFQWGPIRGQLF